MSDKVSTSIATEVHPFNVGIALPYGPCIGGTTTWGIGMVRHLRIANWPAVLLEHSSSIESCFTIAGQDELQIIPSGQYHESRVQRETLDAYQSILPAVLVPNFSEATYATCAKLSQQHAEQMRIIGYCHAHLDYYSRLLSYYEPIIHQFVGVSDECGDLLRALLPHRADDIVVRPYGIEVPKTLQRDYAPADQPLRLLYAGRIQQDQKRIFDYLTLANELIRREVDFRLRIVGEGTDKVQFIAKCEELGSEIKSRVEIERGVPPEKMPHLYSDNDVCVMVSEEEGTSVFMIEAMSYGCVPVVTNVSGTAAAIQSGENGFRHDVGDMNGIAASIEQLANDRSLVDKLGHAAHTSSYQYDFGNYVQWFQELSNRAWGDMLPRVWPANRRVFPPKSIRTRFGDAIPWARYIWQKIRRRTGGAQFF